MNSIRSLEYKLSVRFEENAKSNSIDANQLKSISKNSDSQLRSNFKKSQKRKQSKDVKPAAVLFLKINNIDLPFLITKTAIHRSYSYFEELNFLN